jgi:hypothetical protein
MYRCQEQKRGLSLVRWTELGAIRKVIPEMVLLFS